MTDELGATRIIVAHSDIAHPISFADLAQVGGITLVPDEKDDGTNVISLPTNVPFEFSYGKHSFARHLAAANSTECEVQILRNTPLSIDIDDAEDLANL